MHDIIHNKITNFSHPDNVLAVQMLISSIFLESKKN